MKHELSVEAYREKILRVLGESPLMSAGSSQEEAANGTTRFVMIVAACLFVACTVAAGLWWTQRVALPVSEPVLADVANPEPIAVSSTALPSIAVLPFANMSSDPDQEYFSEGIAEEILSLLARNPKLKVISRSSAFSFKEKDLEISAISTQLGVDHVLEGSVRKAGDKVRIITQLVDARADQYLWSETFDRSLEDVFAVQTEIAVRVAQQLNVALLDLSPLAYSNNSEAYPLFSQARQILSLAGTVEDTLRAKSLLEQAIEIDPSYVPAVTEMGRAYAHLAGLGVYSAEEAERLSDETRARALSIDPNAAVANAIDGWLAIVKGKDFAQGVESFKRGLAFDPTNLDILRPAVPLLNWFRKHEESLNLAEYVVERDPLCVICIGNLARVYMDLGRYGDAERVLHIGLALSPANNRVKELLGHSQLLQGNNQAAMDWFEQLPERSPIGLGSRAMALHGLGKEHQANEMVAALVEREAYLRLALYYAHANDASNALRWLKSSEAAKQMCLQFFGNEHLWADDFGFDAEWLEFLESVGLSETQIEKLDLTVSVPV